jgi:MoaA/NifB/PqqE/SkfB family radical SAM enzyme
MKLSVIIPVFNGAHCLADLFDSLAAQRSEQIEIIVVDDASVDATAEVVSRYPWIRLVCHATNRGVGAARNSGAEAARGDLLLFLDADTVAEPDLLHEVGELFVVHPELAAASGVYCERNRGRTAFARYLDVCEAQMRAGNLDAMAPGSLSGSVCVVRRSVFLALGGFAEDRRVVLEDVELGLRLARAGHLHWLSGKLRVAHRQPGLRHYLRELVPRTRHYLTLLRHFGAFNEVMGGATEGGVRLAILACVSLLPGALIWPGPITTTLLAFTVLVAGWMARQWIARVLRAEGLTFLPTAVLLHVSTTVAIGAGGALGALDLLRNTIRRRIIDAAVVFAYLKSLLTPRAGGYLIHFLTHRCMARCSHCFDHPQRSLIDRPQELDLTGIRALAASAGPLGHVSLTGGEPLLRDDLSEILLAWYEAGVRSISLSTAGAYPEKLAHVLANTLPRAPSLRLIVTVSVDALGNRHDRLRGMPGLFVRVEETLSRLQTMRVRWAQLRLHACLTLSSANAADAPNTLDWLARWRFDQVELNALRGTPAGAGLLPPSAADYDQARAQVARLNGAPTGLAHLFARLDEAMFAIVRRWREPWPCGSCLAGKRLAVVLADGEVLPCEMLRDARAGDATAFGGFALGRLDQHGGDLRTVMASQQAERVRRYIADTDCRCSFECAIFATMAYRPWLTLKHLATALLAGRARSSVGERSLTAGSRSAPTLSPASPASDGRAAACHGARQKPDSTR